MTWGLVAVAHLALASGAAAGGPAVTVLVDTNGDGRVSPRDAAGKNALHPTRIARFLPNLDDDGGQCLAATRRANARPTPRFTAAERAAEACGDASDAVVNGPRDVLDLAPIRLTATRTLPATATARLTLSGAGASNARLFVRTRTGWRPAAGTSITGADLRRGVDAGIEGKALAAARARSYVRVTLTARDGVRAYRDSVAMRLAQWRMQNDLMPSTHVVTARPDRPVVPGAYPSTTGRTIFDPAIGAPPPGSDGFATPAAAQRFVRGIGQGHVDYIDSLRTAVSGSGARFSLFSPMRGVNNRWTQDHFEAGFVQIPRGKGVQRMRVIIRPPLFNTSVELGPIAGRLGLVAAFGNRDLGIAHIRSGSTDSGIADPSLGLGGNLESMPPWKGHPHGAIFLGIGQRRKPDINLERTLRAQSDLPMITMDVDWQDVGHVDEIVHVFSTPEGGWTLGIADPRRAVELMRAAQRAGGGAATFGDPTLRTRGASIDALLADPAFLADQEATSVLIDGQIASLSRQLGMDPARFVRIPVLMAKMPKDPPKPSEPARPQPDLYGFRMPDAVNGLSVNRSTFVAPAQHGPIVQGEDIFQRDIARTLGALGVNVRFVEDRVHLHANGGEVHCGSNALRALTGVAR